MGPRRSSGSGATSRRTLLRGATGVAAAAGLSACTAGQESAPAPQAVPTRRLTFPGDPGPDRIFLGSSLARFETAAQSPVPGLERISMSRRFYEHHQVERMLRYVRIDARAGILPCVSFKLPDSWEAISDGAEDYWLDAMLDDLDDLGAEVMLALHHEPENDTTRGAHAPEEWVRMQRYVRRRAARRAPKVTTVPILMSWTFDPASGRDPRSWIVPGAEIQGVDVYNRWRPFSQTHWEEFPVILDRVRDVMPSIPLLVPEFGCPEDPNDPARAVNWLRTAFDYSLRHNVVGMAYFNSAVADDESLLLTGQRLAAFDQLLSRPEVARL